MDGTDGSNHDRAGESLGDNPAYEPDGYGHTLQMVQVCKGHREVTFRR